MRALLGGAFVTEVVFFSETELYLIPHRLAIGPG